MNRDRARSLRNNATEPEKRLWDRLRGWRKDGFPVRRQVPIGPYIVDFACHSCRVVVELDGGQHNSVEGRRSDAERDAWLEANGYRVLRFWNSDLQANLPEVLETIRRVLAERDPHPGRLADAQPPGPPLKGEGETRSEATSKGEENPAPLRLEHARR